MTLTSKEIESIEQVVDDLEKFREDNIPAELKMLSRHGQLIVMIQKQIDDIVVVLLPKIPEVGKFIRDKFQDVLRQAELADRLDPDTAYFEDARLRGLARQFVEELQQIAHKAREDRKRRILKLIFYIASAIVGFLAALLTILHYLGWM